MKNNLLPTTVSKCSTLKVFVGLLVLFIVFPSYGQMYKPKNKKSQFYRNQRLEKPLFRWVTGDYARHGLQLSVGPNYTLTGLKPREEAYTISTDDDGQDYLLQISRQSKGLPGFFAEIGMTHITKRPRKWIHYYDWGIGFKYIGGQEFSKLTFINDRDSIVDIQDTEDTFYNGYLYGRFDVHSVYQINPHLFLDNSLGVSIDYLAMPGNKTYTHFNYAPLEQFQRDFTARLHYSFGVGIKPFPSKGFFFVPSIEIPIFGIYEWNKGVPDFFHFSGQWNKGNPQIFWFSSRYYPITLRLKFVLLFKKKPYCPPVEVNDGDREQFMGR